MINTKYSVGDVLYIADYYDICFVAIVEQILIDKNGIQYIVKNHFGENELSTGIHISDDDEYDRNDGYGEPFYSIIKKVGEITQD